MTCVKCGYDSIKDIILQDHSFCSICALFAPKDLQKLEEYKNEKVDWKLLETFRKNGASRTKSQIEGMDSSSKKGRHQARPPMGYSSSGGNLKPNEDALKVHRIFSDFLKTNLSFNKFSKQQGLSFNGLKKFLTNKTYLGEIKFNGKIYKGNHKAIIDEDLFVRVAGKLR
jgi:hypothetical protein